jgi:hypothetical protein
MLLEGGPLDGERIACHPNALRPFVQFKTGIVACEHPETGDVKIIRHDPGTDFRRPASWTWYSVAVYQKRARGKDDTFHYRFSTVDDVHRCSATNKNGLRCINPAETCTSHRNHA